jgi:hypothetical protein
MYSPIIQYEVRQREMHTNEPLVAELTYFDVEIAV